MDLLEPVQVTIDGLLAAIADGSLAVTNFIRSVRSSRTDLAQVTRELSDLRLVLELLRDERDVPPQMQSRVHQILDGCGAILRRIGNILGLHDSSRQDPARPPRPPRWSVKERVETSNLCNCLQTYREALALVLEVASLKSSREGLHPDVPVVPVDVEEIKQESSRILAAISDLRDVIPHAEPTLGDSKHVLESYLVDLTNYTSAVCEAILSGRSELSCSPIKVQHGVSAAKTATETQMAPANPSQVPQKQKRDPPPPLIDQVKPSQLEIGISDEQDAQWSFEGCGPWFPPDELSVPFYNNQEQVLPLRSSSYHVPRSPPPPQSPPQGPVRSPRSPRSPHYPPPLLPPPTAALPMLPPQSSKRFSAQRQIAELPSPESQEVRHIAQYYNPYHHVSQAEMYHREAGDLYHARHLSSPVHQVGQLPGSQDYAFEIGRRNRAASEQHFVHQPQSPDSAWPPPPYHLGTPPLSGQSSQRTSFQPSSDGSVPSRDTFRSSVSTGDRLSSIESTSPNVSPRVPLQPTFENVQNEPPAPVPSPRPPTARSSGSVSSKAASLMEKLPALRSTKRRSLQASPDDSAGSTLRTNSMSSGSSLTVDQTPTGRTFLQSPLSGSTPTIIRDSLAQLRRAHRQIEIVPAEGVSDGKGPAIHHLEISPSCSTIASQHMSHVVKLWSVTTGAVECVINYSSKVQAGPRSRMYFLRPLAIISEASTLVAITTSFGNTIEIWNWSKKKRVQTIDHAARWACVLGDAFEANMRPLAVYRSESDRIDLFSAVRDAKKPFVESRKIDLKNADLPFVPKFPDLTFSATGPLLVGAAGPRPGAPPEMQQTILLAWQIDASQDSPRPYRWVVPEHPELSGALPASLASYGSVAISIWHPANFKYIVTAMGEDKKVPISVNVRHVLVWDLATNRTRIFQIPNAQSCISPDCRYVAFCDVENSRFVVLDIASGYEIWSGPDEIDIQQAGGPGVAASGQLLGDISKVTEFRFTDDSGLLFVADIDGTIGIYEVRQTPSSSAGAASHSSHSSHSSSGASRNSSGRSGNGRYAR